MHADRFLFSSQAHEHSERRAFNLDHLLATSTQRGDELKESLTESSAQLKDQIRYGTCVENIDDLV